MDTGEDREPTVARSLAEWRQAPREPADEALAVLHVFCNVRPAHLALGGKSRGPR